jgi:hypothetical protein
MNSLTKIVSQWKQTEAGRISSKRYLESDAGKAHVKQYNISGAHKSAQKRYEQFVKGKATQKRYNDKRRLIKKIYNQTKYQCICGSIINTGSKSVHILSKKHKVNLLQE